MITLNNPKKQSQNIQLIVQGKKELVYQGSTKIAEIEQFHWTTRVIAEGVEKHYDCREQAIAFVNKHLKDSKRYAIVLKENGVSEIRTVRANQNFDFDFWIEKINCFSERNYKILSIKSIDI